MLKIEQKEKSVFKIEQSKRSQCLKWNRKREKSVFKIEQRDREVSA